ncbi:hypothetical protein Indivirus_1_242 [Indivirus ILV1]|uniref:Uncharacterized protein n=1 Tax=Indivirus ILV1 TaxID=1977633 RepID=A0A1V0SD26_9VIRU|nr:hypothetical protein Indivirus_1_242 [Indivirus ILV1]
MPTQINIDYDEDKGKFIIKNKILWIIPNNQEIFEKDLSILKINDLKSKADMTTLSDYDIDMLYRFAKIKFNYHGTKDQFISTPMVQLFPGLNKSILKTNEIMPLAYEHVKDPTKSLVIENFDQKNVQTKKKNYYIFFYLVLCLIIVVVLLA